MAVLDRMIAAKTSDSSVIDLGATLGWYGHGSRDPTTWIEHDGSGIAGVGRFVRATWTPEGPATLMINWAPDVAPSADTWGPGADWLLAQVPAMTGNLDEGAPHLEIDPHPVVAATALANRNVRFGASATLYHELLPTILGQRITYGEAKQQWNRLCRGLSEAAPGPFTRLLLPPAPDVLRRQPSWWFHPLGIEHKRVNPLIEVARHSSKMWDWAELKPPEGSTKALRNPWSRRLDSRLRTRPCARRHRRCPCWRLPRQEHGCVEPRQRSAGERRAQCFNSSSPTRVSGAESCVRSGGHGGGAPKFGPKQTPPADVKLVTITVHRGYRPRNL